MKRMKKKLHRCTAVLLLFAMLLTMQAVPAFAEMTAAEVAESGQDTPEAVGAGMPANPVHHCTKQNGGTDTTDWSYVYFGSYPQTEVTGDALTSAITGASYDAKGDAWVNGTKYRRIRQSDANNSYTCDGYYDWSKGGDGTYHYFKWERIKWRVLQNNDTDLFLLADRALDCKDYNEECIDITWENCTMRKWLNETFYQTAFNDAEQAAILPQAVINDDNPECGTEGGKNTNDSIYLLSIEEARDPPYGFCEYEGNDSVSRRMKISEFAYAMGVYQHTPEAYAGNCFWWLRSPGGYPDLATIVLYSGEVLLRGGSSVLSYITAVVPALHINLTSDLWSMTDDGSSGSGGNGSGTGASGTPGAGTGDAGNGSGGTTPGVGDGAAAGAQDQKKVKKISIQTPSLQLATGKKVKLTAKLTPANAADKRIRWKSSNTKYASISKNGTLTLKKAGAGKKVTITAEAKDGSGTKAGCTIKIMKHAVKKISLSARSKTIKAGKTVTLKTKVTATGKNANKKLKFTSSNTKYATVSQKGVVKTKKAGAGKTVTITAVSTDGSNKKAKIRLKLK